MEHAAYIQSAIRGSSLAGRVKVPVLIWVSLWFKNHRVFSFEFEFELNEFEFEGLLTVDS